MNVFALFSLFRSSLLSVVMYLIRVVVVGINTRDKVATTAFDKQSGQVVKRSAVYLDYIYQGFPVFFQTILKLTMMLWTG